MDQEMEHFKYYMAAERTMNLIFTIEQVLEFYAEYKIEPDEDVKNALGPKVDELRKWLNAK